MSATSNVLRAVSVAAVLLAGSCASQDDGEVKMALTEDGAANHPIMVEPATKSIALPFSAPEAGLMPDDSDRFNQFISAYAAEGNGAISVSAPEGPDSQAAITYFAERMIALGIPRARIMVGTHDPKTGHNVELSYIGFGAHTDPCGDWSVNLTFTAQNKTSPNFGCAVQQNIAAMIANPHDLIEPAPQTPTDPSRRQTIMDAYEKGQVTTATKTADQRGVVSGVAQ